MSYIELNPTTKKELFLIASHKALTLALLLLHLAVLIIPNKKEQPPQNKEHHHLKSWIHQLPKDIHLTDMHHTQQGLAFTCHGNLKRILLSLENMTIGPEACFINTNIHKSTDGKLVWESNYKTT